MKPNVIIYLLFSLFVLLVSWEEQHALAVASFHQEVSKEDAIRLRILANSDAIDDQLLKRDIRDQVNASITEWVRGIHDLEEAKLIITRKLPQIETIVEKQLKKRGLKQVYDVRFAEAQFPTKLYGNIVYPAGVYDAVVITLGEGKGENWWCVLFPPLCFLDMSNGEAVEVAEDEVSDEASEEVEVSFFIVDLFSSLIERIFSSEQA